MTTLLAPGQEKLILSFVNAATAEELQRVVRDDPGFGSASPRAYGIRRTLASRIIETREGLPVRQFASLSEVDAIAAMGPDTLHDLIASVLSVQIPPPLVARLKAATRVVVVTGAGVSAPSDLSGIPEDELESKWTPAGFVKDVQCVWEFLLGRRNDAAGAKPNAAHRVLDALGRWLVSERRGTFTLVTQNQDQLHQHAAVAARSAGAGYPIIELHGDVFHGRCTNCGEVFQLPESLDFDEAPGANNDHKLPKDQNPRYFVCTECGGMARPTVLWLTEPYPRGTLDVAGAAVLAAEVVLFVGTSGRAPAIRWLLHEAHWHARAFTAVIESNATAWIVRDGTPGWPGAPIVDERVGGDVVDALASLQAAVGWPD